MEFCDCESLALTNSLRGYGISSWLTLFDDLFFHCINNLMPVLQLKLMLVFDGITGNFQMTAIGFYLPVNTVVLLLQLGLVRGKACVSLAMNSANMYDDWKVSYMRWNRTGTTHWKFHNLFVLPVSCLQGSYIGQFVPRNASILQSHENNKLEC